MSNEQKQKLKDYRKEYKYAEKKSKTMKDNIVVLLTLDKSKNMVILLTLGKSKNMVILLPLSKSKKYCCFANFGQVT